MNSKQAKTLYAIITENSSTVKKWTIRNPQNKRRLLDNCKSIQSTIVCKLIDTNNSNTSTNWNHFVMVCAMLEMHRTNIEINSRLYQIMCKLATSIVETDTTVTTLLHDSTIISLVSEALNIFESHFYE